MAVRKLLNKAYLWVLVRVAAIIFLKDAGRHDYDIYPSTVLREYDFVVGEFCACVFMLCARLGSCGSCLRDGFQMAVNGEHFSFAHNVGNYQHIR